MKKILLTTVVAILSVFNLSSANQNIANLITSSDWNTLFPNRAQAGHNQGATDDFYSFARFSSAVDEISNYSVTFSTGPNGQGTSVAVTKAGGGSWTYIITGSSWSGADYTVDYSTFCNTGNDYNDKRELAAFFANITKETTGGWVDPDPTKSPANQTFGSHGTWGLYWLRELAAGNTSGPTAGTIKPTTCYTTGSTADYSPVPGKCYYGRGPIQMSYYYNYGNFSEFLYNNTSLVSNPDLVEQDGELAFLSAIWFWMTPQCPKPSCHQVMQEIYDESATSYSAAKMSKKGFLHTVNIINGSVECRSGVSGGKPELRSKLYRYYMSVIGFTSGEIANEDLGDYETLCNETGSAMQGYTSCDFQNVVVNNCSTPALGADVELSGGTAALDANVTLKSGETIAWYKDDVLIGGETGTTYTATETGTYKVVITGTDCTKEDWVVVSAEVFICSEPALGKDKELVSGTTTLDANITLASGETIAWYKDNVLIGGATSTTYTATAAGTYKAVTTRPGCTKEDEIIIYNEGEGPTCSKPALGGDTLELIGGSVVLNSNITALQDGETIAWYKDGVVIWNATGLTYTATTVGVYKVVVTGADCTEEDETEVAVICSDPDLGSETSLTNGSVVLDAGIAVKSGETISWFKDGSQIWGQSGTTYTATALGTYKVVVTGPGWPAACTTESEVVVSETTCSTPALGEDLSLCQGSSVTLDANVTLESGETIKWYKDNVEIGGETGTTYTANASGVYKAEVNGPNNCVRSDEITVADGGAQPLQVNASNNGQFCAVGAPSDVTLTVTGGAGTYDFYDVATDGTALGSGASFTVNSSHVQEGQTKTFYVQEPSGPAVTVGETTAYTSGAWANQTTNQNWNNYRVVFDALDEITLESVDIVFYQNHTAHDVIVTVYEYGTENVVVTKTVQLDANNISYVAGSTYPLNKVQLDLELDAGNYELSFIGSSFTFHIVQSGVDYSDTKFSSAGIVDFLGVNQPGSWNYPAVNPSHLGVYNWVFKSGGTGACGRATVDVTADCGIIDNVYEVNRDAISVYPNPAFDVLNVSLGKINAENGLIEIYSSVGQLVMSQNVSLGSENIAQFETADLKGGLYFIKVLAEGRVYTTNVVITK